MATNKSLFKRIELLQAIRDGKPHTLANRVIAPLVAAGFLEAIRKPNYSYASVCLTIAGLNWLQFQEDKLNGFR